MEPRSNGMPRFVNDITSQIIRFYCPQQNCNMSIDMHSDYCRNHERHIFWAQLRLWEKEGKEEESAQPSPGCSLYRWPVWAQKGPHTGCDNYAMCGVADRICSELVLMGGKGLLKTGF